VLKHFPAGAGQPHGAVLQVPSPTSIAAPFSACTTPYALVMPPVRSSMNADSLTRMARTPSLLEDAVGNGLVNLVRHEPVILRLPGRLVSSSRLAWWR
jgi:hypothetical protein